MLGLCNGSLAPIYTAGSFRSEPKWNKVSCLRKQPTPRRVQRSWTGSNLPQEQAWKLPVNINFFGLWVLNPITNRQAVHMPPNSVTLNRDSSYLFVRITHVPTTLPGFVTSLQNIRTNLVLFHLGLLNLEIRVLKLHAMTQHFFSSQTEAKTFATFYFSPSCNYILPAILGSQYNIQQ